MKRWIAGFTALCGLIALTLGHSAIALADGSQIRTDNKSDAAVQLTAYTKGVCNMLRDGSTFCRQDDVEGRWCVEPGVFDKHDLGRAPIYQVQVEVMHKGCRYPVMLHELRRFHYPATETYTISGENGRYFF